MECSTGGESLITQQYIKDLQQENKVLKDTGKFKALNSKELAPFNTHLYILDL